MDGSRPDADEALGSGFLATVFFLLFVLVPGFFVALFVGAGSGFLATVFFFLFVLVPGLFAAFFVGAFFFLVRGFEAIVGYL